MAQTGVNKVILVGRLGNDPDIRYTPNGKAVTALSVATSESWIDKKTNQRQERTEWHRVVLFDKLSEIANQYLRKGSQVYLEGKLQTRKWKDQHGLNRYSTEVVVHGFDGTMQMLGDRPKSGPANNVVHVIPPQQQEISTQKPAPTAENPGVFDEFDDDIPF